jgi:type II secretory pathway pseudopilin PulG
MVELVIAMLLMATLAAIAVPRLTQRSALEERGARDQLRGLIEHARQSARVQNREVCVLLAAAEARVVYGTPTACNAAAPLPSPEGDGPQRLQMPNGVALAGPAALRFDARGRPFANTDQTLSVGNLALIVRRSTGHVAAP